jgi:hypothetical protein
MAEERHADWSGIRGKNGDCRGKRPAAIKACRRIGRTVAKSPERALLDHMPSNMVSVCNHSEMCQVIAR